jgi:Uma2 family endonuclease
MTVQLPISTASQTAKLSAADFWLLADAGAFKNFVKTELIEGELLVVNAVHTRHARIHAALTFELGFALRKAGLDLVIYSTPSTELSDDSVPEPDIAVAGATNAKALAGSGVKLAVEISDSTLDLDMGRKMRLYARHGIPEYWVVDVEGRVLHQMWTPSGETYAEQGEHPFGDKVTAATIQGLSVETDGLLG